MAKKVESKALVKTASQELEEETWRKEMAESAQQQSAQAPVASGGNWISTRNSRFTYQNEDLGQELDVIVLCVAYENAYYLQRFNPDNRQPPACFAIGIDSKKLIPSDASPKKQGGEDGSCASCWANQFSSGDGRGKACGNRIRLALLDVRDAKKTA